MRTVSPSRPKTVAVIVASSLALLAGIQPAEAAPRYYPLKCRGPMSGIQITERAIRFTARAGTRPDNPARGECVWRNRPMNRAGEHRGGKITVTLALPKDTVSARPGGSFASPAAQAENALRRGGIIVIEARRTGTGTYVARPRAARPGVDVPRPSGGTPRPASPAPLLQGQGGRGRIPLGFDPDAVGRPSDADIRRRPGLQPQYTVQGGIRGTAAPYRPPSRDCSRINPGRLRIRYIAHNKSPHDSWTLEPNSRESVYMIGESDNDWLFNFWHDFQKAQRALRILRHYRPTQVCYVGRPDPSLTYFLVSGRAPAGSAPGESCKPPFNPRNLKVKNIQGRWTVVQPRPDGKDIWLFKAPTEQEAREIVAVIKWFGFTRDCYIKGRYSSKPYMMYLRK